MPNPNLDVGGRDKNIPIKFYHLIILDRSASMSSVIKPTVNGFNENVTTIQKLQRENPNQEHRYCLITFNSSVESIHWKEGVDVIEPLTAEQYAPESTTALYDAIGQSCNRLKAEIDEELQDEKINVEVMVTILTDGEENASREYNGNQVADLLKHLQQDGTWTFTYIGANHDVVVTADRLNIPQGNTMAYKGDQVGTRRAFADISMSRGSYVGTKAALYDAGADIAASKIDHLLDDDQDDDQDVAQATLDKLKAVVDNKKEDDDK